MAERDRPHLFVPPSRAITTPFTPHGAGGGEGPSLPARDRTAHGRRLASAVQDAVDEGAGRKAASARAVGMEPDDGLILQFESFPGLELALESLEDRQAGAAMLSVRTVEQGDAQVELATVYVPDRAVQRFLRKVESYLTEDTATGQPRHRPLIDPMAAIRLATVEALWTEGGVPFPPSDEVRWWEVWLRRPSDETDAVERFRAYAETVGLQVQERVLAFPDRFVLLTLGSVAQLSASIDVLGTMAELRTPRELAAFFEGLPAGDQAEWIEDLLDRLTRAEPGDDPPVVCVLDTGVQAAHPLLKPSLDPADVHTLNPAWGGADDVGHGTEMAGLALYGDELADLLAGDSAAALLHRLESVKMVPRPPGQHPPELYGRVTAEAVARPEITAPGRRRTFSMAVTVVQAEQPRPGQPTSWSAAVDAIAAGRSILASPDGITYLDAGGPEDSRLILVSAGNVRDHYERAHLDVSDVHPVLDPAHAWNALTVGAYTELVDPGDAPGTPVAPAGELSPFSRTSVGFDRQWCIKPDICMEGGNLTVDGNTFDWPIDMQLLTTNGQAGRPGLLTVTHATSAATAQAARLTATLWATYPDLWPESVRALTVHAARWTPRMRAHFTAGQRKHEIENLVRRYGMGVPTADRALRSATNELTLIAEQVIHPFTNGRMREIHWFDLPWPTEQLEALGAADVQLRVTLSHFIEPNPSRRGWRGRFRYASHGLRFALKLPTETRATFEQRLNKQALDEDQKRPSGSDSHGWLLGEQARNRGGSIINDIWSGSAADLAARGTVAVFPVTGWWKELPSRDRSDLGVRYALVMSIESSEVDIDLWTPVQQQIAAEVEVAT